MHTRSKRVAWLTTLALLFVATPLAAQTTGRLVGRVVDASGGATPGAMVAISSPSLQGSQTQTTDSQGEFRFPSLPPGRYAVKATLSGFRDAQLADVEVQLDRTTTLTIPLQLANMAENIQVVATTSAVDTTSTVTGVNVGVELFSRIPIGRDFYAVTRVAPGTTTDAVGPVVYGSSGAENQYIIDGLNTTGVELGDKGKTLNFDFVQEVEVKTGGLSAEYGRMTGGVVNVITKSGSNTYRGSLFGFVQGGGLQADESTRDRRPATTTQVVDLARQGDGGFELGGFAVRDRLWFFGAYNRVNEKLETTVIRTLASPGSPAVNSVIPATTTRDLHAAKLTYSLRPGHTFNATIMGDPSSRDGNVFAIAGPSSTWQGVRETGGSDVVGKYEGAFGRSFLLQGLVARHKEFDNRTGPGRDTPLLIDVTVTPNATSGGFGFFQEQRFFRDVFKADGTYFFGDHSVKGGLDYEHIQAENNNYNGGAGQRIYRFATASGQIYYRHRYYVNDRAPGYDRNNPATWTIAVPLTTEPDSQNTSFYIQDQWRAAGNLTINAGVRWEGQNVRSRDRETAFKLSDNWAPRVGVIYDVTGRGKSKIYANYGRFFESIPMDINIRAFGGEVQCFCYNFSASPANYLQDPLAPRRQGLLGGTEPVDPDLKGQFIDEAIIGAEFEVIKDLSVGVKYTYRDLGRVIEDFLIPSEGNYFIANPGTGIGSEMAFYDFVHTAPAPEARRVSKAFEVTARKRFADNWQFLASAVFAKLEGNYDGTFQASTGQLDPNINSAFDYADFLVNAEGRLSNDRNVQIKLDGSYEFSSGPMSGLNLGLSTYWLAGTPLNAYGYSFAYANWEYYLVPRGTVGRGPSDWETSLQLNYPVRFGNNKRLNLQADIFNLFNRQAITQYDERYNLAESGPCGGIPDTLCNGDGGIVTTGNNLIPAGTLSNVRATAVNPDYLKKGVAFTAPFSLRLGARFSF